MVQRRDLVGGGFMMGLAALAAPRAEAAAAAADDDGQSASAINRLRETVERRHPRGAGGRPSAS